MAFESFELESGARSLEARAARRTLRAISCPETPDEASARGEQAGSTGSLAREVTDISSPPALPEHILDDVVLAADALGTDTQSATCFLPG